MNRDPSRWLDDEVAREAAHWFLCNREGRWMQRGAPHCWNG